ncbi:MAG: inorganic phosphate transporter [Bacteroidales bacterium]|nr:inorganic phosphate transporter [Bacteroidales bacterium]
MLTVVVITISLALVFDFLNGMNDAANSIATVVSTKVLPPFAAVAWAAFFNFAAVFIFGAKVATTIGKGIVDPHFVNEYIILAALVGAIIWVYSCTFFGLPISVSHALIGGLIGPVLFTSGPQAIFASGLFKVLLFMVLSPLIGLLLGFFIMLLTNYIFRNSHPRRVDSLFRGLQLFSSAIFSIGHGTNDAQKTMGIISVLLFTTGHLGDQFYVPIWVILLSYTMISLGTLAGGWRVIKTLGIGLTNLKPVQGFSAETAGAITVIGSTFGGIPVSTTHTITGSIMGVGMSRRITAVRWGVAGNIIIAWVLTVPGTFLISAGVFEIIKWIV